jgi:hypothetical protein
MNFNILDYTNLQYNSTKHSTNSINNGTNPKLVDNGVKLFFKEVLKGCNKYKQANYNTFYNILMFSIFCLILAILLYSRYKGPHNYKSYYEKTLKDKEYIMSKLVYYNRQNLDHQQKIRNNMITNLPDYSNHPEANLLHKTVYFS